MKMQLSQAEFAQLMASVATVNGTVEMEVPTDIMRRLLESRPTPSEPCQRLERIVWSGTDALSTFKKEERDLLHALIEAGGVISAAEAEDAIFLRELTDGVKDGIRRRINSKLEVIGLSVRFACGKIYVDLIKNKSRTCA